mmetsp:Transcript_456/g.1058  ORF Transcript_456/g.1058 Transcript_456/m.1058 type:complete len:143 (-) Transcript_456:15-443(-)
MPMLPDMLAAVPPPDRNESVTKERRAVLHPRRRVEAAEASEIAVVVTVVEMTALKAEAEAARRADDLAARLLKVVAAVGTCCKVRRGKVDVERGERRADGAPAARQSIARAESWRWSTKNRGVSRVRFDESVSWIGEQGQMP